MKEITGDIWDTGDDWVVVPTNGIVRRDGEAVMGRGLAKQAARQHLGLPYILGQNIEREGNIPFIFSVFEIITFPVKWHWSELADLKLIESSFGLFKTIVEQQDLKNILLPHIGCGNGGRDWETEVKPILISGGFEEISDKVTIVSL